MLTTNKKNVVYKVSIHYKILAFYEFRKIIITVAFALRKND